MKHGILAAIRNNMSSSEKPFAHPPMCLSSASGISIPLRSWSVIGACQQRSRIKDSHPSCSCSPHCNATPKSTASSQHLIRRSLGTIVRQANAGWLIQSDNSGPMKSHKSRICRSRSKTRLSSLSVGLRERATDGMGGIPNPVLWERFEGRTGEVNGGDLGSTAHEGPVPSTTPKVLGNMEAIMDSQMAVVAEY
ncbi:hypothetical protein C8R44DRAFT_724418 [Mycena epipterygia]|nr:hypothetical protein C8R44DRAFT_724418 [Mycena epipterygia]